MNHPHPEPQARALPQQALQYPRPPGFIQQHRPNSPRQSHPNLHTSSSNGYLSQHAQHGLAPQQAPNYVPPVHGGLAQHTGDGTYYGGQSNSYSIVSNNNAAGGYAAPDSHDNMAAHAAINRQSYPPISSYQTPQSNSPASMHSPQTDAHGRSMYTMSSIPQSAMYYHGYQMQQPPPPPPPQQAQYTHQGAPSHRSMSNASPMLVSHQQQQQHYSPAQQHPQAQPQPQQAQSHLQHTQMPHMHQQPGNGDSKQSLQPMPRQTPVMANSRLPQAHHVQLEQQQHQIQQPQPQPHQQPGPQPSQTQQQAQTLQSPIVHQQGSPSATSNPAPGPIPATTPLVVKQDENGVQWIAFQYSRDRVKLEYTMRCDVESVDVDSLSPEFKSSNCVYPRACCPKDQYKGNRYHYESECNGVGWALAELNPTLRDKRGLIQRAVDSWRNSNRDPRLRSRRVRRMAKITTRNSAKTPSGPQMQYPLPSNPPMIGMQAPPGMPQNRPLHDAAGNAGPHHHNADGNNTGGGNDASAGPEYSYSPNFHQHRPASSLDHTEQFSIPRSSQHFSSVFPQMPTPEQHASTSAPLPSEQRRNDTSREPASKTTEAHNGEAGQDIFGGPLVPNRRQVLVENFHKADKTRVTMAFEKCKMEELPDSHLKANAVFPRSYFPRSMVSPPASPRGRVVGRWDDFDDGSAMPPNEGMPVMSTSLVAVPLLDGSVSHLSVPQMTTSRRAKEFGLNELSQKLSWTRSQLLSGKTTMLQRALNGHRVVNYENQAKAGYDDDSIPSYYIVRPGKRRWQQRRQLLHRHDSP